MDDEIFDFAVPSAILFIGVNKLEAGYHKLSNCIRGFVFRTDFDCVLQGALEFSYGVHQQVGIFLFTCCLKMGVNA